jgi:hypothetical protein
MLLLLLAACLHCGCSRTTLLLLLLLLVLHVGVQVLQLLLPSAVLRLSHALRHRCCHQSSSLLQCCTCWQVTCKGL